MSGSTPRVVALLFLVALGLAPRHAAAQDLNTVVEQIATAWGRGNFVAVANHAARGGIALDVDGASASPIAARQVAAMLRRVFDGRETVDVRPGVARVTDGSPARAFSEIAWTHRGRGTTIPERSTVFVAYVREDGAWRVTQIRIMR
jgi:hypothetical protein